MKHEPPSVLKQFGPRIKSVMCQSHLKLITMSEEVKVSDSEPYERLLVMVV